MSKKKDVVPTKKIAHLSVEVSPTLGVEALRTSIESGYEVSRERAIALTKLDECALWLTRCEPRETAAPAAGSAVERADNETLAGLGRRGAAMGIPDMGSILRSAVD